MTGATRAKHLVWYAREILREARACHERKVHNGVVRRSQECLEMCAQPAGLVVRRDATADSTPRTLQLLRLGA